MDRVTQVEDLRQRIAAWRAQGECIGLVPTMGNLHAGHLSLVELAGRQADRVVVSVFVNPAQFGPGEDFASYPRTLEQDAKALALSACDLMYLPDLASIYPDGPDQHTRVMVPVVSSGLCGDSRPGHFEGVATVVTKLLCLVQPDLAVFGQKDFQQLMVIRKLVNDLALPVDIVAAPTLRESDGLAMSSRNCYLDADQRQVAPEIYRCLTQVRDQVRDGQTLATVESTAIRRLTEAGLQPDYVSVRCARNLTPARSDDLDLVVLVAAQLGSARLIDNLQFSRVGSD